jgi:transcriptional regulator GlxA family with amidase domain
MPPACDPWHFRVRLQEAQDLLASTTRSIQEVADILGFHSALQLSKQFKQAFGKAPQQGRTTTARPRSYVTKALGAIS